MKTLRALSERLYKKTNRKVTIVAVVIFLLFTATVFPLATLAQKAYTGTASMPDTMLFASSESYYDLAESYGDMGRRAYIWLRFTFDLTWPAVYGFVLAAGLSYALKKSKHGWVRALNLLPFFGVLFDLIENILAVYYMALFPRTVDWAVSILPTVTAIKWAVLGIAFCLLLVLFVNSSIISLLKRIKRDK